MAAKTIPAKCRTLIIGGGPAGSISASILAREGDDVVVLERDQFPRHHIGESLLPSIVAVLEFIGALGKVEKHGFLPKPGGIFAVKHGEKAGLIDFEESTEWKHSYQVVRAEFDDLLFRHAGECGAVAVDQCKVTEIIFSGKRPTAAKWRAADGREGTIEFEALIDASGLNALMSQRYLKNRELQESFKNLAIGRYWKGARPLTDLRPELKARGEHWKGASLVESFTDGAGWAWGIPLHDGTLSVGLVMHKDVFEERRAGCADSEELYAKLLELCPETRQMIGEGEHASKLYTWQDYSYSAEKFAGPGFRLAGDAAGFIDPLFSTGVHMASVGALSATASLQAMRKGEVTEEQSVYYHDKLVRRAYMRLLVTVAAMYQQVWNQKDIVLPGVTSETFQDAFDHISPLVSGRLDMGDEYTSKKTIQEVMDFQVSAVLGHFKMIDKSIPALLSGKKMMKMEVDGIDAGEPVDGLYIRLERGRLGLERVGMARSQLNKLSRTMQHATFKLFR